MSLPALPSSADVQSRPFAEYLFGGYAKRPFTERRSAEEAHTLRLPFRLTFPR